MSVKPFMIENFMAVAPSLPFAADVKSIRNKWAPVYDMPDSEKDTQKYQQNEMRKNYYADLATHAERGQTMHRLWDAMLESGNHSAVKSWLSGTYFDLPPINANFSPTDGGLNPLIALAQKDTKPNNYLGQALTAQILITNGVDLVVPDRRNLLPADYALMSGNTDLAITVVMATLDHYAAKYKGDEPAGDYIPAINAYFVSEGDERRRMNGYANMIRNLGLISEIINDRASDPADRLLPSMTDEALSFWDNPLKNHSRHTFEQIAEPDTALTMIYSIAVEASERERDLTSYSDQEQKLLSLGLLTKKDKTLDKQDATNAVEAYLAAQRHAAMRVTALRRG